MTNRNFNSIAIFESLEQQLVLKIKGDGLGHFEIDGEETPESHLELTFSISFNQTQIKEYVRQLAPTLPNCDRCLLL
jgi:hypothetical protein